MTSARQVPDQTGCTAMKGLRMGPPAGFSQDPCGKGGAVNSPQVGAGSTKKDTPKKGTWNPISINQTLYETFCGFELKFLR